MNKKWIVTSALVALCSLAQATVTINVNEVGSDVVFDWSGSLDITGAINVDEAGGFATYVKPDWGQVWLYSSGNVFYYALESGGPYNVGSGSGYNFHDHRLGKQHIFDGCHLLGDRCGPVLRKRKFYVRNRHNTKHNH